MSTPTTAPIEASSCNIAIPDYKTLRQTNITKINDYYNTLLASYTKNYTDYSTQSVSQNVNDRTYADTTLKPQVANYNTQIINLSQSMIDSVDKDTNLILDQKNDLEQKTQQVSTIMDNIKLLKDKDIEMDILSNSRNDSLTFTKSGSDNIQFMTYVYIGINILLVLIIIGLIIYMVYSNYTSSSGNSSRNNTYKNITTNNGI